MKAILIEEYVNRFSELQVKHVPSLTLEAGNVIVNVRYAGLNHVDLLYAKGSHQNNHSGLVSPPFVLGLEFSGTVAAVASGRSIYKVGDNVFGSTVGSFAEQVCVKESALHRIPTSLSLKDAAGIGAATAPVSYGALVRVANIKAGETVLVHAAGGGLGVMACQIAKAIGCKVLGTVGSEHKARNVMEKLDIRVIRYDREGWEKEVLEDTGGRGVDVVYDTVGLVAKSLRCTRYGGKIVVAGFAGLGGKMESLTMNRILLKGATVMGYRFGESGRRNPAENEAAWAGLTVLLERGLLKPIIYDETFMGLESVPTALQELHDRKVWGKAIVELQDSVPKL